MKQAAKKPKPEMFSDHETRAEACQRMSMRIASLETDIEGVRVQAKMQEDQPVPMILWCPACTARHIDVGEFAFKPHHTHACQNCGVVWRPAVKNTVGVQFLPGYKNG